MERVEELLEELIEEIKGLRSDLAEVSLSSVLTSIDVSMTSLAVDVGMINEEISTVNESIQRLGGLEGHSADLDDLLTAINNIQDKLPDASRVVHDLDDIHSVLSNIDVNTEK